MYQAHKDPIRGLRCVIDGKVHPHLSQLLVFTSHQLVDIVCIRWPLQSKSLKINYNYFKCRREKFNLAYLKDTTICFRNLLCCYIFWQFILLFTKHVFYVILIAELVLFYVLHAQLVIDLLDYKVIFICVNKYSIKHIGRPVKSLPTKCMLGILMMGHRVVHIMWE